MNFSPARDNRESVSDFPLLHSLLGVKELRKLFFKEYRQLALTHIIITQEMNARQAHSVGSLYMKLDMIKEK